MNSHPSLTLKYEGTFTDGITGQLTALLDDALAENQVPYGDRTRLRALVVEQVQNVQRYSAQEGQGCLEIGTEDGRLFVETTNPITPEARTALAARLDALEGADPTALRARFREEVKKPLREGEPGAGLGFLVLSQKSARPLAYRFVETPSLAFQLKSYL